MVYYAIAIACTMLLSAYMATPQYSANGIKLRIFRRVKTVWLVLLPLIFLALFRWNVGSDSVYESSYWISYHYSADGINDRNFEPAFYWFMKVFAELEVPYFWFLFAHGLFFFSCVCYAIHRGTISANWSIAVFFALTVYFDSYSSLRQSLAEAISLIGWAMMESDQLNKKKDFRILGLFFISGFFHKMGWLNIPIYLVCKLHFRDSKNLLIFAGITVACTPFLQKILPIVMSAFADGYETIGLARINLLVSGTIFLMAWVFSDEICRATPYGYMYVNQALCIFILMLNSGALFLPYRVYDMIKIGYVFIIPRIVSSIRDHRFRFLAKLLIGVMLLMLFLNFATHEANAVYMDYKTVFSDFWRIINLP